MTQNFIEPVPTLKSLKNKQQLKSAILILCFKNIYLSIYLSIYFNQLISSCLAILSVCLCFFKFIYLYLSIYLKFFIYINQSINSKLFISISLSLSLSLLLSPFLSLSLSLSLSLFLYIYICVCVCVCMSFHIYLSISVYSCVCIYKGNYLCSLFICMYECMHVCTKTFQHGQDANHVRFISRALLVGIQNFLSPWPLAIPRLKSLTCPAIYPLLVGEVFMHFLETLARNEKQTAS